MEVGERIKKRREELNMTQDELARKVGYTSRSSVAKVEANANGMVQSKLNLFASALQTSPSYLLGWDEDNDVDLLADITIRMRSDEKFFSVVKCIYEMSEEQLDAARIFLTTFNK